VPRHFRARPFAANLQGVPRYARAKKPEDLTMPPRLIAPVAPAFCLGLLLSANPGAARASSGDGIVKAKSAYGFDETVNRLKADIAGKGIMFFMAVDQSKLGAGADIKLPPSTLLVFGNPPLGIQFLTANPNAGLDWPVRLLVTQDDTGQVWAVYTDFDWIKRRHGITDRNNAFETAVGVIASITSSVAAK
jgi:uncharacterized protein (DUF302 family)